MYQNAGNAKIKGGELELQGVLGHGLSLNFSGSYIDAYYTYVNPSGGDSAGTAAGWHGRHRRSAVREDTQDAEIQAVAVSAI